MTDPLTPESLHDLDWSVAKAEDSFFQTSPRYPFFANLVVDLKPSRLFDLGCGSGYLVHLIQQQLPELEAGGIDISQVALERATPHFEQVWKLNVDQANLPVSDASYEVVTCVEVLEHLYDPGHALSEIYRILRPRGTAVLTVPNLAYWRYRLDLLKGQVPGPAADRRHLHQFDSQLLHEAVNQAGFALVRIIGFRTRFKMLASWKPDLFSDILIAIAEKR